MRKRRTAKIMAWLVLAYGLLVLPGYFWPSYFESPAGLLVLVPGLSIYLFHKMGVPGLLEHHGFCGWGLCEPTPFGWVFLIAFWLLVALLVAWCIAGVTLAITNRRGRKERRLG
jgi:hypothetical protein